MSNLIQTSAIESALILGDLSKLTTDQRLSYFKSVCESVGLNPLTKPFEFITLNGKLTLYAKRDATDQLRKVHGVSIAITSREKIDDVYVVTAKAKDKTGREDESTGAVFIAGLKGDNLANAYMKAETKAKRRVTLSVCGLGLLDETEVADIPPEAKQPAQEPAKTLYKVLNPNGPQTETVDIEPAQYIPKFGKYGPTKDKNTGQILKQGTPLGDLDIYELNNYVNCIQKESDEKGKEIKGDVAEFMRMATDFLNSRTYPKIDTSETIPF